MIHDWMQLGLSAFAAFLASSVECVEALTIILAVGGTRGWREAFCGTAVALVVLAAIVGTFGAALERIPLAILQNFVGGLLVILGMRWLKKSILRYAGVIPLHDEDAAFAAERRRSGAAVVTAGWDFPALATTFQITMLEGAEVVFIVLGIGAGGHGLTKAAIAGASAAVLLTAVAGAIVHRPLTNVPENLLKFVVGILLTAFGTFWSGEGAGLAWPGGDLSLAALTLGFFILSIATIRLCSETRRQTFAASAPEASR